MKGAIPPPPYLPWPGYLAKGAAADLFVFLDTVQYEKNGWQNRNRIKTRNGPRWLTAPVHARLGTTIRDVMVDTTQPWRARHFRAIDDAYAKAPSWPCHRDALQSFYGREWERLAPLAVESAQWLARALGVSTPTRLASDLALPEGARADATARLVGGCQGVGAATHPAGGGGAPHLGPGPVAGAGGPVAT